jgi:hypothetical protein
VQRLDGVDAVPVRVEVDINSGLPAFTVVDLPDVKKRCMRIEHGGIRAARCDGAGWGRCTRRVM